ncbi:MAG: NDP-sugar synthase, partial [Elusimicrobia bacterium]|nr:NDP-sugar synthase [Elusimicrobiota bacterium]
MRAVILIGGEGTRLRPLTLSTPKPLLPILNRPSLAYQIKLLKHHGIRDIVLCVGYLSNVFKGSLGDGRRWGVRLRYVHEATPLGTGGAIKNAQPYVNETVLISNGDIITTLDLTALLSFHRRKKASVTIALHRVADPTAYGLVEIAKGGRIRRFLEKPSREEAFCNTINAGTYVFEPKAFSRIPPGINYSVERGLFPHLLKLKEPLYGFLHRGLWLDIGTIGSYLHAHAMLLKQPPGVEYLNGLLPTRQLHPGVWVERGITVGPQCTFNGQTVIGEGCVLEAGVHMIGPLSLGRGCRVGKAASLQGSVVLDHTVIGEGARLEGCAVGRNCRIEPYVTLSRGTAI